MSNKNNIVDIKDVSNYIGILVSYNSKFEFFCICNKTLRKMFDVDVQKSILEINQMKSQMLLYHRVNAE